MAFTPRGLIVKISTPNIDVNGVENLKVTVTVTNTGDEVVKLLNDPRGVLNAFPTKAFTITGPAGSNPLAIGAIIHYIPEYAAGLTDPRATIILAPGVSVFVTHDLSAAYDFTRSGTGEYCIKPSDAFFYVDADGAPHPFHAAVKNTVKVRLSGNLVVPRVHGRHTPTKQDSS